MMHGSEGGFKTQKTQKSYMVSGRTRLGRRKKEKREKEEERKEGKKKKERREKVFYFVCIVSFVVFKHKRELYQC